MPTISVIVPVYNSEKYLHRCINSILTQTFTDFELILINDGSTDSSGQICDVFEAKDVRIKAIHKKNGGVSSARNVGLEVARGEWIVFADSDDWIEADTLTEIVDCISHSKAEYLRFGYVKEHQNGERKEYLACGKGTFTTHDEIFKLFHESEYFGFLWNSVFKRTIIGELKFDESLCWLEDHIFSFDYLRRVNNVSFISKILYHYTVNGSGSLSTINDPYMAFNSGNKQHFALQRLSLTDKDCISYVTQACISHYIKSIHLLYVQRSRYKTRREFYQMFIANVLLDCNQLPLYLKFYLSPIPFFIKDTIFYLRYSI